LFYIFFFKTALQCSNSYIHKTKKDNAPIHVAAMPFLNGMLRSVNCEMTFVPRIATYRDDMGLDEASGQRP